MATARQAARHWSLHVAQWTDVAQPANGGYARASTYLIPFVPNVTRRRERFFKSSKILVAHIQPNRCTITGCAYCRDLHDLPAPEDTWIFVPATDSGSTSRANVSVKKGSTTTGIDYILQTPTAQHDVFFHTSRWRSIETRSIWYASIEFRLIRKLVD